MTEPALSVARVLRLAEKRTFCHLHGAPFVSILQLDNAATQRQIFAGISATPQTAGVFGKVITPRGVTRIPWAETPRFQRSLTEQGITNPSGFRGEDPQLARTSRNMSFTVDQGRAFVAHAMPATGDLFFLRDLGIKAVIARGIRTAGNGGNGHGAPGAGASGYATGAFMTGHLHETLHTLTKSGLAFTLIKPPATDETARRHAMLNGTREFYKGFWCATSERLRCEAVEVVVDMYGSHSDTIVAASRASVGRFLTRVGDLFGRDKVGVMHGKGRGFMGLADEAARRLGMVSMGVGIDVETVGQHGNDAPEMALDFTSAERAYRQKLMDHIGLFKVFNIGGFGTLEEAMITICSTKLLENMPTPLLFVDESATKRVAGGKGPVKQHLWADIEQQARMISEVQTLHFPGGADVDLTVHPLGQGWVKNIIHCVTSYDDAADLIEAFVADPAGYWRKAGLSPREIQIAWSNYASRMTDYGYTTPAFLQAAMKTA